MKLAIEESVLRQALAELERVSNTWCTSSENEITALRSALDAAEKVEPVGVFKLNTETGYWHQLTKSSPRFKDDGAVELFTNPAPAVPDFTCPYCKHEQPYAEIHCHNCNSKYTIDAAPTPPTNTDSDVGWSKEIDNT